MGKHTPGPWYPIDFEGTSIAYKVGDKHGVICRMEPTLQEGANARLIAAAPEMLETLRLFAFAEDAWLQVVKYINSKGDAAPAALAVAFERMHEAIAKATGGEPTTSDDETGGM